MANKNEPKLYSNYSHVYMYIPVVAKECKIWKKLMRHIVKILSYECMAKYKFSKMTAMGQSSICNQIMSEQR